jgi:hypothetical protein
VAQGVEYELFTIPEVLEVDATTGHADLVATVLAKDDGFSSDQHEDPASEGILRTSTVISVLEVMPTRMEALLRRMAGDERPS